MNFTILTLFPELAAAFFDHGMIARGIKKKRVTANCINIRKFAKDRHNTVDDRPYGGGSGMVMKPETLQAAILYAKKKEKDAKVVLMSPQGTRFRQKKAREMAAGNRGLIFVCGRYEGIDERIYTKHVDEEISIGDYIMTGGELAAMVIIDSVIRLIPGVLGSCASWQDDSFTGDRLEYAQYTRPEVFENLKVPEVLLSGDHEKIRLWRKESSLKRTFLKRPDLLKKTQMGPEEKKILKQWCRELENLVRE